MSLGLCALFKVQSVLHCKVKFAIVTILQLQKIEKNKEKYTKPRNILLVTIIYNSLGCI